MFMTAARRSRERDNARLDALERENAELRNRLAALTDDHHTIHELSLRQQRERQALGGVFHSLGSFGESLGGVRTSFLGLATTLSDEKQTAVLEKVGRLEMIVRVQACSDEGVCLAPTDLPVALNLDDTSRQ